MPLSLTLFVTSVLISQPAISPIRQEAAPQEGEAKLIFSATAITAPEDRASSLRLSHIWSRIGAPEPRYVHVPNAVALKRLGFHGLDGFVRWSEVEPIKRDQDPYLFISDACVELATTTGLKPALFLITSPFASSPQWFRDSRQAKLYACLQHNRSTPTLSIWNDLLRGHIDRQIQHVTGRYAENLDLLVLGPAGSYGETAYPSGGGFRMSDSYHQGVHWWCFQPEAREDFRNWLIERHGSVGDVASEWVGDVTGTASIATSPHNFVMLPGEEGYEQYFADAQGLPSNIQRRFLDFARWYSQAMEEHAAFWLERARKHRPNGRIALFAAGNGHPMTGGNLARLVRLASQHRSEVRYWPPSQSPAVLFACASPLVAAAAQYDVPLSLDSSGAAVPSGLGAFLWFAAAYDIHDLATDVVLGAQGGGANEKASIGVEILQRHLREIPSASPRIEVALLTPESVLALEHGRLLEWQGLAARLRDVVDLHLLSESMIRDGALESESRLGIRFLISPPSTIPPSETVDRIAQFVAGGGVWIVPNRSLPPGTMEIVPNVIDEPVIKVGKGYIVPVVEPTGARGQRLSRDIALILKRRDFWEPLEWPSFDTDGVYVTDRADGTVLLFNTLPSRATVKLFGGKRTEELESEELRVVHGP